MKFLFTIIKTFLLLTILLFFMGCAANKELISLKQNYDAQEEKISKQNQQNISLTEERNSLFEKNNVLVDENNKLKTKLVAARESLKEISNQEPECPEAMTKGVVFKVQIGAYEDRNIAEELTTALMIDTEGKGDLQKTVVGQFRSYQSADRLKNQLRAMGVQDAWIVPYENGNRVPLKKVLSHLDAED